MRAFASLRLNTITNDGPNEALSEIHGEELGYVE
jgi:hypothetical protein